jgi:NAD(P)-dependent dehydrogenase (short-subunit alcohol dehydrogenase family)
MVIVVGSSGLLGSAVLRHLHSLGIDCLAVDKSPKNTNDKNENGARYFQVDICNEDQLRIVIDTLVSQGTVLDCVINFAYPKGKAYGKQLDEVSYQDFTDDVSLHIGAFFNVMKIFGQHFAKQRRGHVISIASIYGFQAPDFEIYHDTPMTMPVQYAATKAAIINLNRYFASYYKRSGVRFNCVSPGGVENNQPLSFVKNYEKKTGSLGLLRPESLNGLIEFLISDKANYINGENIVIDDGFSV